MTRVVYDEFLGRLGKTERDGQREAVRLLCELSDSEAVEHYAIQAPTGTGKSYAALLAGVHNAWKGRRTVIGTSTLVLSDQYSNDIKDIASHFTEVSFAVLKGASNYYCGNKAAEEIRGAKSEKRKQTLKDALINFRKGYVDFLPVWATSDPEFCADCGETYRKKGDTACEYARARGEALKADVVVTTHAMLNLDAKLRQPGAEKSAILGQIHLTIFDEAHKASGSLIYDEIFGMKQVDFLNYEGVLPAMPSRRRDAFIKHFEVQFGETDSTWYSPTPEMAQGLLDIWPNTPELMNMFAFVKSSVSDKARNKARTYVDFLFRARKVLEDIVADGAVNQVALWAVPRKGTGMMYEGLTFWQYKMKEMIPDTDLIEKISAGRTAWMSATLGTESDATYSLKKCGMRAEFFVLDSPFNYSAQLNWLVRTESQAGDQAEFVNKINSYWSGGCAVLTPYHKRKERLADRLRAMAPGTLVQDQANPSATSNAALLNSAIVQAHVASSGAGNNPVLVGVEIFSTGVDLPGNQLTKLIIADLFPIREDWAFISWRRRWIEAFGGDGFDDYVLPERAITLEQQIGRVIRRETDTGVVVFYVSDRDGRAGSEGEKIIHEAMRRFPGARQLN